jgi:hypothetical protein
MFTAPVRAFLLASLLVTALNPQTQSLRPPPLPVDPTPIDRLLSETERVEVQRLHDPKKAVEAYLKISDSHLAAALSAIEANSTSTSERELDIYNKAVAEAVKIAFSQREGRRGLAKRIEQRLYKQIIVLERIQRRFPPERVAFADAALEHAKRLRVRALNEFATDKLLKEPSAPEGPGEALLKKSAGRMVAILSMTFASPSARSQASGDYLSQEEADRVRAAQRIDERMKVFMKIADRRLDKLVEPKQVVGKREQKKEEEEAREWGQLADLSRTELLQQYARAIEEAIVKLEDAHERNPKNSAIPKALAILRDATNRHLKTLHSLESEVKSEGEQVALRQALEQAERANQGARAGLQEK